MSKQQLAAFMAITVVLSLGAGYGGGYIHSIKQEKQSAVPNAALQQANTAPEEKPAPQSAPYILGKVLEANKNSFIVEDISPASYNHSKESPKKKTITIDKDTSFYKYSPVVTAQPSTPPANSSADQIKKGHYVEILSLEGIDGASIKAFSIQYSDNPIPARQ